MKNRFKLTTLFLALAMTGAISMAFCGSSDKGKDIVISGTVAVTGNHPYLHVILRTAQGVYVMDGKQRDRLFKEQNNKIEVKGKVREETFEVPGAKGTIAVEDYKPLQQAN